ncbi:MAG TPA: flagellar hook-length control protein FliK [Macromonas sp.]|nr:flagellar hook-length control protein FliK [Macromonas sp.]
MKTEHSTSLQQEQALQRSNAHKARGTASSSAPAENQPFAALLAGLGQAAEPDDQTLATEDSTTDATLLSNGEEPVPEDAAALAALLAQSFGLNQASQANEQGTTEATSTPNNTPRRGRGTAGGILGTAELQQARGHTAPGRSVSAMAQSDDRTQAPPVALTQQAPSNDAPQQSWHMLSPGHPGSALEVEAAPIDSTTPSTTDTPLVSLSAGSAQTDAQPGGQMGSDVGTGDNSTVTTDPQASDSAQTPDFSQNLEQAMDSLGAQVSYWASNNIQRATMRLDAGLKNALEVEVRLKDGVAQLDFRTDDEQAREAIKAQATSVLTELLARSGIALEGLSVNTSSPDQGSRQYGEGAPTGWTALGRGNGRNDPGTDTIGTQPPAHRPAPQGALDVFA